MVSLSSIIRPNISSVSSTAVGSNIHSHTFTKNRKLKLRYHFQRRDYYYDDYYDDYGYDDRDRYESRRQARRDDAYDRRQPPHKQESSGSRGGSALGIIIRILFMILIIAFFIMPQFEPYRNTFIDYLMAGLYKYQEVPDSVEFTVQREMIIESDDYIDYTLYLPIPQNLKIDGKEAQTLKDYVHQPKYSEIQGGQWIWHEELENGGRGSITIIYYFYTAKISWDISIRKSGTIDDIDTIAQNFKQRYLGNAWPVANYQDNEGADTDLDGIPDTRDVDDNGDLRPEKYRIEPSNPTIQSLLEEILVDEGLISYGEGIQNIGHLNVYEVVKAIYDRIDDKCSYPTIDEQYQDAAIYGGYPKWATGTWNDKRGDCDDQSILFISLCRAAGIPAMLEIGALYDIQMRHWEGHGWANVLIPYSDDYRLEKDYDYVTPMVDIVNDIFLFRDPNRFSEWVDDGVKGKFNETGIWQPSHLEDRYLAWEYYYEGSSVDTSETYTTLEFDPKPPEKNIYL